MALKLVVFVLACLISSTSAVINLNMGILLPRVGPESNLADGLLLAAEVAIKRIRNEGILNSSFALNFTELDTDCNRLKAVEHVYNHRTMNAYIGPACSEACVSSGLLAATLNTPMISYACSSLELSNRQNYPTFARTQPYTRTYTDLTPDMILEMLKFNKWSRACIIATEDDVWSPLATILRTKLTGANMTVPYTGLYTANTVSNYKTVLEPVKETCRSE